jgi:molybdopterin converting factor small subunit
MLVKYFATYRTIIGHLDGVRTKLTDADTIAPFPLVAGG